MAVATATDAIPIYKGQEFYVPNFEVKLQGSPLQQDVIHDVIQVSYKDNIEEIDSFELTINNWDADKRGFKYSDSDLFDPGKRVELWMGYFGKDSLRLMLTGEITALRPSFPAAGQPTLGISGLNLLHHFREQQVSQAYVKMTDSQIARKIGSRLGVKVDTDPQAEQKEESYPYLFQDNKVDIVFLMERARSIGYDLVVREKGKDGTSGQSSLYFGPSVDVRKLTYQLTYGRSLIEFQPNLDTANQVSAVTVRGWDQEKKRKIEYTATRNQSSVHGVGPRGGQARLEGSFKNRKEIIATRPINSLQEAKTLATETLDRIAKNMLRGTGSTVGLPDLRAGTILMIDGLGDRFSGRYFVTSTTHTIGDGGYTLQFECRREEI